MIERKIENLPIIIEKRVDPDGEIFWVIKNINNGGLSIFHNSEGPAQIRKDGRKYYFYLGECYPGISSDDEWQSFLKLSTFK